MTFNRLRPAFPKETLALTSMRRLRFLLAALTFVLTGSLVAPSVGAAFTVEANSLQCPTQPPGRLYANHLGLDQTTKLGDSGMMVRVSSLDEYYRGFIVDFFLPTATLRGVSFVRDAANEMPVYRVPLCGSIYELRGSGGGRYDNPQVGIEVFPRTGF